MPASRFPHPPCAGVINSWNYQPFNGTTVGTNIPIIASGTSSTDAYVLVPATARLLVDGIEPTAPYTKSILDRQAYFYWDPVPKLIDGSAHLPG